MKKLISLLVLSLGVLVIGCGSASESTVAGPSADDYDFTIKTLAPDDSGFGDEENIDPSDLTGAIPQEFPSSDEGTIADFPEDDF